MNKQLRKSNENDGFSKYDPLPRQFPCRKRDVQFSSKGTWFKGYLDGGNENTGTTFLRSELLDVFILWAQPVESLPPIYLAVYLLIHCLRINAKFFFFTVFCFIKNHSKWKRNGFSFHEIYVITLLYMIISSVLFETTLCFI